MGTAPPPSVMGLPGAGPLVLAPAPALTSAGVALLMCAPEASPSGGPVSAVGGAGRSPRAGSAVGVSATGVGSGRRGGTTGCGVAAGRAGSTILAMVTTALVPSGLHVMRRRGGATATATGVSDPLPLAAGAISTAGTDTTPADSPAAATQIGAIWGCATKRDAAAKAGIGGRSAGVEGRGQRRAGGRGSVEAAAVVLPGLWVSKGTGEATTERVAGLALGWRSVGTKAAHRPPLVLLAASRCSPPPRTAEDTARPTDAARSDSNPSIGDVPVPESSMPTETGAGTKTSGPRAPGRRPPRR